MLKPCYSFFRLWLRHPNKCSSPQLCAMSISACRMGGKSWALLIVYFPLKEGHCTTHEKYITQALSTPIHADTWHQSSYTVLKQQELSSSPHTLSLPHLHRIAYIPVHLPNYLHWKDVNNNTALLLPAHRSQPQHTQHGQVVLLGKLAKARRKIMSNYWEALKQYSEFFAQLPNTLNCVHLFSHKNIFIRLYEIAPSFPRLD